MTLGEILRFSIEYGLLLVMRRSPLERSVVLQNDSQDPDTSTQGRSRRSAFNGLCVPRKACIARFFHTLQYYDVSWYETRRVS